MHPRKSFDVCCCLGVSVAGVTVPSLIGQPDPEIINEQPHTLQTTCPHTYQIQVISWQAVFRIRLAQFHFGHGVRNRRKSY